MADVVLSGVSKSFGATRAVAGLSLSIAKGEFVVLLGPTGAGKTTTLRLIAGLERPDGGSVFIGGHDATALPPAARDVSFVFQQYSLYPHLTVRDNLAFPLRAPGRNLAREEIARRVEATARLVRIDHKLDSRATRLSGGEMQRVAIGRALVRRPAIFLMDEPLSSLDAKLRADMRLELKRIQRELGATVLYVTHDQIEAMTMADRIGILSAGELVQVGTPREIYTEPADVHIAGRLGQPRINLLPRGVLSDGHLPTGTATVGARTEHLAIARAANGQAAGRVDRIEHLGDQDHLHVRLGEHRIVTLSDPHAELEAGDAVSIAYRDPLCFDAAGRRIGSAAEEARP
jgi:multiple sugar transport system ATP-binding protein